MKDWTMCKETIPRDGNLMKWSDFPVYPNIVDTDNLLLSAYCSEPTALIAILPGQRNFEESPWACKAFKSTMYVYTKQIKQTIDTINFNTGYAFWTGFKLKENLNSFVADLGNNTELNLNYTDLNSWREGEPNGGIREPCVVFYKVSP